MNKSADTNVDLGGRMKHAFRFSLFAFRFSLFAFRFSLFAFRFSLFALTLILTQIEVAHATPVDGEDDAMVSTNASARHHAEATAQLLPQVDIYWKDGSGIAVVASCAGCLLDVSLEVFTGADPSSTKPLVADLALSNGPVDEAILWAELPSDLPLGIVTVVALVDEESGVLVEERYTFFARISSDGKMTETTWIDFACARGFVQCFHDDRIGHDVIDLGLAESINTSNNEITEGK